MCSESDRDGHRVNVTIAQQSTGDRSPTQSEMTRTHSRGALMKADGQK